MKKNMKKFVKASAALLLATMNFVGCGGTVIEKFDGNKTQIYVNVFNGGLGIEWMEDLKNQFNAAKNALIFSHGAWAGMSQPEEGM